MEDAAKAIELAVGVIIFIVAVTVAILLYNNLADTANNALSINDAQNSITFNKNNIPLDFGYIYSPEDVYYLIKDIKANAEMYTDVNSIVFCQGHTDGRNTNSDVIKSSTKVQKYKNNITYNNSIHGINDENSKYKIKFNSYKYNEKDILTELNTHKPTEIYIIHYLEEF